MVFQEGDMRGLAMASVGLTAVFTMWIPFVDLGRTRPETAVPRALILAGLLSYLTAMATLGGVAYVNGLTFGLPIWATGPALVIAGAIIERLRVPGCAANGRCRCVPSLLEPR